MEGETIEGVPVPSTMLWQRSFPNNAAHYVRERGREGGREGGRERGRERENEKTKVIKLTQHEIILCGVCMCIIPVRVCRGVPEERG